MDAMVERAGKQRLLDGITLVADAARSLANVSSFLTFEEMARIISNGGEPPILGMIWKNEVDLSYNTNIGAYGYKEFTYTFPKPFETTDYKIKQTYVQLGTSLGSNYYSKAHVYFDSNTPNPVEVTKSTSNIVVRLGKKGTTTSGTVVGFLYLFCAYK